MATFLDKLAVLSNFFGQNAPGYARTLGATHARQATLGWSGPEVRLRNGALGAKKKRQSRIHAYPEGNGPQHTQAGAQERGGRGSQLQPSQPHARKQRAPHHASQGRRGDQQDGAPHPCQLSRPTPNCLQELSGSPAHNVLSQTLLSPLCFGVMTPVVSRLGHSRYTITRTQIICSSTQAKTIACVPLH